MGSRISPHSQCQKCTIGTEQTTPYQNNTTSESYHYVAITYDLQRPSATFSDLPEPQIGMAGRLGRLGRLESLEGLRGTRLTMEFGQLDNGACDSGM